VLAQAIAWLVLGAAVLALMLHAVGLDATRTAIEAADPALLVAATAVLATQIPLLGFRWWLALRLMGRKASLVVMIRVNTASNVVNFALPGHVGEAVTSWWLSSTRHAEGVPAFSAIIACKAVGSIVNVLLAAALLVAVGYDQGNLALAAGLGLVVAAVLAIAAVVHRGTGSLLGRLLAACVAGPARLLLTPVLGGERARLLATRIRSGAGRTWDRFRGALGLLARRPGALLALTAVSLVKVAVIAASFHLVFRSVGISVDLSAGGQVLVSVLNDLGRFVFIHVPLDLGGQEAVILGGLEALGIGGAAALAAALLYKVVTLAEKLLSVVVIAALAPWHRTLPEPSEAGVTGTGLD
jgi:uncharacterized membrane protein YbhN (UPF0104 family)